jgi:DUF1680 family protein
VLHTQDNDYWEFHLAVKKQNNKKMKMENSAKTRRNFVKTMAVASAVTAVLPLLTNGNTLANTKQPPSAFGLRNFSELKPILYRIPGIRRNFQGIIQEYISAITKNWLLKAPDSNPAILEMFADRDKQPHRDLLPWSGEFAGKYLTGATQILRLTKDSALQNYLSKFVTNLVSLQTEDGYLGPASKNQRLTWGWDVWGHYHSMLGLLFWYEDTNDKPALRCAVKIGDLLCRKFLKTEKKIVDVGSVEMNHAPIHSLCLLYKITKTPEYLELAQQIADKEFQDSRAGDFIRLALAGKEFYQVNKPRWESLHSLQGILELYLITGNDDYRKAFEQLWWSIVKLDRHNNGGFSSGEKAQGNPYHQGAIETCCTIAWMAMGIDMLRLTGNSIVADELELSTLNQVLGYQHRSGKWCTYNTPMDGARLNSISDIAFQIRPGSEDFNCCSANAPRGLGMISDWDLMTDGQGLVLNWYGPSTIETNLNGKKISITQETDYPKKGQVLLTVSPEREFQFPLKLRIPNWSANSRVEVNGKPVAEVKPGTYLVLDRKWKSGDKVQIDLDMSLHYWVGERECAGKTSIYRGPLLLVYELSRKPGETIPEFDAAMMNESIVSGDGSLAPPLLRMECSSLDGKKVRLRDFATAGDRGLSYLSWLKVEHVEPAQFSVFNPMRFKR